MNKQTYHHEKNPRGQTTGRRGMLGLDRVKAVMVMVLLLAVIAIAMFLGLNAIIDSNTSLQTRTIGDNQFNNQTITLNQTGTLPAALVGRTSPVLSNIIMSNGTAQVVITAGNFTQTGGVFTIVQSAGNQFNNTAVNVSAAFTYTVPADAVNVRANITTGVVGFFLNVPTIFTVLGAVMIILVVSLILVAVSRFGQASGAQL